jgi:hypothetical protein
MNGLHLSEKEKKWIIRLEKDYNGAILRYIVGTILIVVSVYYFIQTGDKNNIHKAILYGILGGAFIAVQYTYKTYYKIIKKMKEYIEDLEKRNV